MKTHKLFLAATIATLVSSTAYADQIAGGTTGYAAHVVDGNFGDGVQALKTDIHTIAAYDMPFEFQSFNQNTVGKVDFDINKLLVMKVADDAHLNYVTIANDDRGIC